MSYIYLSGASLELKLCESYRDRLRKAGHTITVDWMSASRDPRNDLSKMPRARAQMLAKADLSGVAAAATFWMLVPDQGVVSTGCWVELGYCLAISPTSLRRRILVSGLRGQNIFASLADKLFATHEEAFEWIVGER